MKRARGKKARKIAESSKSSEISGAGGKESNPEDAQTIYMLGEYKVKHTHTHTHTHTNGR
jgi:hypothetical protein